MIFKIEGKSVNRRSILFSTEQRERRMGSVRTTMRTLNMFFFLLVAMIVSVAPTLPVRVICTMPHPDAPEIASSTSMIINAVQFYGPLYFPQYTWQVQLLSMSDYDPQTTVLAWATNGTSCSAFVGPGSSGLAIALSPMMDRLWIDPTSSAVSLSDKTFYPQFTRVIPSDLIGAAVLVAGLKAMNWKQVSLLYVDTTYSGSFASGLSDALVQSGGFVERSRQVSQNHLTLQDMMTVVSALSQSETRVLAVVMASSDPAFPVFLAALDALSLQNHFYLVLPEAMCSQHNATLVTLLAGALCATYDVDHTAIRDFEDYYSLRNTTAEAAMIAQALPAGSAAMPPLDRNVSGAYDAFSLDATYLAMYAINASLPGATTAALRSRLLSFPAGQIATGASGPITFSTATGDRLSYSGVVFNFFPDGSMVPIVKSLTTAAAAMLLLSDSIASTGIYLHGHVYYNVAQLPQTVFPPLTPPIGQGNSELPFSVDTLAGIIIAAVAIAIVAFFLKKAVTSDRFLHMIESGLWIMAVKVIALAGSLVLQAVSMITVILNPSFPLVFVILYSVLSCGAIVVHCVEISQFVLFFIRNVEADNDLDEDEVVMWQFRIAQTHLVGLGARDVPLIAMSFAAILQEQVTPVLLGSLCVSCLFVGMKITELKGRIRRFFKSAAASLEELTTTANTDEREGGDGLEDKKKKEGEEETTDQVHDLFLEDKETTGDDMMTSIFAPANGNNTKAVPDFPQFTPAEHHLDIDCAAQPNNRPQKRPPPPSAGATSSDVFAVSSQSRSGVLQQKSLRDPKANQKKAKLNEHSTVEELEAFCQDMKRDEKKQQRYAELKSLAKKVIRHMEQQGVTGDEVFAVVKPYLNQRFSSATVAQ